MPVLKNCKTPKLDSHMIWIKCVSKNTRMFGDCLTASFSAHREDHFQKEFVQNGPSVQILSNFWRNILFIFGRKIVVCLFVCFVCCNTSCNAVMYLNSTMECFRTVGISLFQFWLILQICKDAIELTYRQEVRLRQKNVFFCKLK